VVPFSLCGTPLLGCLWPRLWSFQLCFFLSPFLGCILFIRFGRQVNNPEGHVYSLKRRKKILVPVLGLRKQQHRGSGFIFDTLNFFENLISIPKIRPGFDLVFASRNQNR
jgi:hypothetical protein